MADGDNVIRSGKRIIINAFDMFTPSHLSFGQWRRPEDRSRDKRRDLSYWTDLAQLLDSGGVTALFIADTFSAPDRYKGNRDTAVGRACQHPMGDPAVPISAMAAVSKTLSFAVTTSTSYEAPYVVAKRFSTLDHLTKGRFGWNVVTSHSESAAKAVGLSYVEHDQRYAVADEYLEVLYKIWEGSWSDTALKEDSSSGTYADPSEIRTTHHHGSRFTVDAPHILDPSPQRTPFLFQAGTSPAGISFAAKHAEGVFVSAPSPHILKPRVAEIRSAAAKQGRDPKSIKVFASITPIVGRTEEEAQAKYQRALEFADEEAGLAFWSSMSGIDLSQYDLDAVIRPDDAKVDARVHSMVNSLQYAGKDVPAWTPRNIGKAVSIGGNGPAPVGTPQQVADVLQEWIEVADLDGFNVGYVVSPGSFEDLVDLLIPELRERGVYSGAAKPLTLREQVYGPGQARLRDDHVGSSWKYTRYVE